MEKVKEIYSYGDVNFGEFEAEKCGKCNEVFFTEAASDKIDEKAKQFGIWGIGQKAKIGYSGNSLIIRVPKKIADFLRLKKGEEIFVRPEGEHKLVVET